MNRPWSFRDVTYLRLPGVAFVVANEEAELLGLARNQLVMERFGVVQGTRDGFLLGDVVIVEHVQ